MPSGDFTTGTHTQASRTLRYKLYVPPDRAGKPLPLVVMLHGCTQNPDDFAAGTAMNELAREQGFIVLLRHRHKTPTRSAAGTGSSTTISNAATANRR